MHCIETLSYCLYILICIVFGFFRDMYGAIGYPLKIARTIIVGKRADLVKKILYILSYFIRCSDVHENSDLGSLESFLEGLGLESPEEDKTPVQEGFLFPAAADGKLQAQNFNSNSVIIDSGLHENMNSGEFGNSVDRKSLRLNLPYQECSSMKGNSEVEASQECNQDEGYYSIVQSDESDSVRCRLATDSVVENVRIENVVNVTKAIAHRTNNEKPLKTKTSSVADIKQQFLSDRSNSMFDELYEDGIETKTIDDVPLDKRVVIHPMMRDIVPSQSLECLTEYSKEEMMESHHKRLGSVGQTAKPKVSPLSRQISSDFSKPCTYNPGRCRYTPTEMFNNYTVTVHVTS